MKKISLFLSVTLYISPTYGITNAFRTLLQSGRGQFHYPLPSEKEEDWSLDIWSVGWGRACNQAFFSCDCTIPCSSCVDGLPFPYNMNDDNTTFATAEGLTALWFGKPSFRGEEVFPGGRQLVPNNPWMSFATMAPRFVYSESALLTGVVYTQKIPDTKWSIELRAMVPYKAVAVQRKICSQFQESLSNVMAQEVQEHY